jgi:hypothetical protein
MRLSTARRSNRAGLIEAAIAAFLLATAQPASATTWGHLRGPFSDESQRLERDNLAAQERSMRREAGTTSIGLDGWLSTGSGFTRSSTCRTVRYRRHFWSDRL